MLELQSNTIKRIRQKASAFSQITLDDDHIVKDNKPDVVKIIHTTGTIVFDETKVTGQSVWLSGKLDFQVLYRSDDDQAKIEELNGAIPFQEKLSADGIGEMDPIRKSGEVEDLSVTLINSRKLAIRAVVDLQMTAEETVEERYAGAMVDSDGYEQMFEERSFLDLVDARTDVFRVHHEITIPTAKPNMKRILWCQGAAHNVESEMLAGKLHVQGDNVISVLYQSEEDEQIQWIESTIPFEGNVDGVSDDGSLILWSKVMLDVTETEIVNDYDGEPRVISVDLVFGVDYRVWTERKLEVLTDVYSLKTHVIPKRKECICPCFLMKNVAKQRLSETFRLENNQEKILQICSCFGKIMIDRQDRVENAIRFEGVVQTDLLYLTSEDHFPVAHTMALLPFEQLVEVDKITENSRYVYDAAIDMLSVNLLDNAEYELKAAIRISVMALEEECADKIDELEEEPLDLDALMAQPGLVGYVTAKEERLWDIAKKYHTTVDEIMETNGLKTKVLRPQTRLIIVKRVGI